ncbi:hypothetical protein P7C73_g824, partial [Tremellales sp. Uapishka_1]
MASSSTLPTAFKLVRQLLAERPRHFHELIKDGVAAYGATTASTSQAVEAAPAVLEGERGKGKGRGRRGSSSERVSPAKQAAQAKRAVPEGHPFVSASFLKSRILPILASQDLIEKKAVFGSTSKSATTKSGSDKPHWIWTLSAREPPASSTPSPWDRTAHWTALIDGESPASLAHQYAQIKSELASARKEVLYDTGKARRTVRDVMAWEGRRDGLTTRLERLHLNVRRSRNRPAKERKRADEVNLRESLAREGEAIARKELESEGRLVV